MSPTILDSYQSSISSSFSNYVEGENYQNSLTDTLILSQIDIYQIISRFSHFTIL